MFSWVSFQTRVCYIAQVQMMSAPASVLQLARITCHRAQETFWKWPLWFLSSQSPFSQPVVPLPPTQVHLPLCLGWPDPCKSWWYMRSDTAHVLWASDMTWILFFPWEPGHSAGEGHWGDMGTGGHFLPPLLSGSTFTQVYGVFLDSLTAVLCCTLFPKTAQVSNLQNHRKRPFLS